MNAFWRTIIGGMKSALVVGAILLLAGCSITPSPESASPETSVTEQPTSDRTVVQWGDYDPNLQATIDGLQSAEDCAGLQNSFDDADANAEATRVRTGHGNTELMTYIDEALRLAECY